MKRRFILQAKDSISQLYSPDPFKYIQSAGYDHLQGKYILTN